MRAAGEELGLWAGGAWVCVLLKTGEELVGRLGAADPRRALALRGATAVGPGGARPVGDVLVPAGAVCAVRRKGAVC